jgi:hypothetical protein
MTEKSTQPLVRRQPQEAIQWLFGLFSLPMNAIGLMMDVIQRRIGIRKMAYIFVLPNMLLFATFSLLPILGNFYYAFTGGTKVLPENRFFVGTANFEFLLQCENYLNPGSCRADLFWRGMLNTVSYVIFSVGGILLFSLVTAIILNRPITGRGFFSRRLFLPYAAFFSSGCALMEMGFTAAWHSQLRSRYGGLRTGKFLTRCNLVKILGRNHRHLVKCWLLFIDCIGWSTGDSWYIV